MKAAVAWSLVLLLGCAACTADDVEVEPAPAPAAGARPQACTAEIVNTYYERPRFTGPADAYDRDATIRNVAELLPGDCAVEPEACVRQVIATVHRTGPPARAAAVRTWSASAACVAPGAG